MEKINVRGKTITLKLKVRSDDAPKETAKFLGTLMVKDSTSQAIIYDIFFFNALFWRPYM